MATYRIQLNKEFDFNKLKTVLPYLARLGISHIYASPILQARSGSSHGYDLTDCDRVSDELGGKDAFKDLTKEAAAYGLGWIQDIVPNHASYSTENRMISDIMRNGSNSKYCGFFDVDWDHPSPRLKGRILAPFLQNSYEECLKNGQVKLAYNDGFVIRYKDTELPVNRDSDKEILHKTRGDVSLGQNVKTQSLDESSKSPMDQAIEKYNSDIKLLDKLLSSQVYALNYWRMALKEINYRRFFDIASMICLRMEKKEVFDAAHGLILELVKEGKISGLRVDHIDGLHDPEEYLLRLRKSAPKAYVVVEKILMRDESLQSMWPVQGTTGYDFLNRVNEVFLDANAEKSFDKIYEKFTGNKETFEELLYNCEKLIVEEYFGGDVNNLARMLHEVLEKTAYGKSCTKRMLRETVEELLVSFPVYRTYLTEKNAKKGELKILLSVLALAKQRNKKAESGLAALEDVLSGNPGSEDAIRFIMRVQQFTGAIMAKGLEDTVLYVYSRLLSLNEVGGGKAKFGGTIEDFHEFNKTRQDKWPLSMNATSTHDTKRGEDVRARLNVLSEIPSEFGLQISKWAQHNRRKKVKVEGKLVPTGNEEYYLYQTLIGALPFEARELPAFAERLKTHMVKAVREAKINSSWLEPNLRYEEALVRFVGMILQYEDNDFLNEFMQFQKKVAFCGCINSLAQTLLKITSPGVPDFYQGTELWDLNLVDPDNRRPIDFTERNHQLERLLKLEGNLAEIQGLPESYQHGTIKLYEIHKALEFRKAERELFEQGEYIPLEITGSRKNHVIGFCRKKGEAFAMTVVPRFLTSLMREGAMVDSQVWKDTCVRLPENIPQKWKEIFTKNRFSSRTFGSHGALPVGEILGGFPVALLFSGEF